MKNQIIEAGKKLKTILINYTEIDGTNEGWREIEPYSFRSNYLLMGYDLKKQGIRSFAVHRINEIKITDNAYTPRWEVEF